MLESERSTLPQRLAPSRNHAGDEPIQPLVHRYGRSLAASLVFLWLACLVSAGQPNLELQVFRHTVAVHAFYAAMILAYAAFLVLRRRLPGPTTLDLPIAALILVYALAVATSIYPRVSLEASLLVAGVLLTFYALHDFDFLPTATLFRRLAALGCFLAALALLSVLNAYVEWLNLVRGIEGLSLSNVLPPTVPRVRDVGDHVNILAMALNLTLPFALALLLHPTRRVERILGGSGVLLILFALFFTLSRGAWLGTAAAIALFALLYLLRDRRLSSFTLQTTRLVILGVVCGLFLTVGGIIAISSWDSRPEFLFRASLSPRQDAAEVALEIIRDRPWSGSGPSTYPFLYNAYSGAYPIENIHPHNGYLNVLVDTGLAGSLVLLAGGIILLVSTARTYAAADSTRRVQLAACIAALASLAVHSFFDSPNSWDTALLPLAAVLVVALRLSPLPSTARRLVPPRALVAGLLPLLLIASVYFDLAHADYSRSVGQLGRGEFAAAIQSADAAASADPDLAAYHLQAGVSRGVLYVIKADQGRLDPALLTEAVASLHRAIAADPRSALAYANLALALQLQDDGAAAVDAAFRALDRAPTDAVIASVAGTIFEWAGLEVDAVTAFARALSYDAGLVESPFWEGRSALRERAFAASNLTACALGRITAIYASSRSGLSDLARECRVVVATFTGDARARSDLAVILSALGQQAEARQEAEEAVRRVPDNPYARTALGLVRYYDDDIDRARHELMLGAYLGDPDAALTLANLYSVPAPHAVRERLRDLLPVASAVTIDNGVQRYLLGVLYYRVRFQRESPSSLLIPGEWMRLASPRSIAMLEAQQPR